MAAASKRFIGADLPCTGAGNVPSQLSGRLYWGPVKRKDGPETHHAGTAAAHTPGRKGGYKGLKSASNMVEIHTHTHTHTHT